MDKEQKQDLYPSVRQMNDGQQEAVVRNIFASISKRYDFLNKALSLRQDISWRKRTVKEMSFSPTNKFLDVATGTGALAIECAKTYPEVSVTGIDFVAEMIERGLQKVEEDGLNDRVDLNIGDATALEFDDNSFDVVASAFGIRNITDRKKALSEMHRVVNKSGMVMLLELTTPKKGFLRNAYSFYLNNLLQKITKSFSKNPAAYEYLADSIINFPTTKEFILMMESVGLVNCRAIPLTLGVCTLYIGDK